MTNLSISSIQTLAVKVILKDRKYYIKLNKGKLYEILVFLTCTFLGFIAFSRSPVMYWADSYGYIIKSYELSVRSPIFIYNIPYVGLPHLLYVKLATSFSETFGISIINSVRVLSIITYAISGYIFFKNLILLYSDGISMELAVLLTVLLYATDPLRLLLSTVPYRETFCNLLLLFYIYIYINALHLCVKRNMLIYLYLVYLIILITRPELAFIYVCFSSLPLMLPLISKAQSFADSRNRKILILFMLTSTGIALIFLWIYELLFYLRPDVLGQFSRYTLLDRIYLLLSSESVGNILDYLVKNSFNIINPISNFDFSYIILIFLFIYSIFIVIKTYQKSKQSAVKYLFILFLCIALFYAIISFMLIYYGSFYATDNGRIIFTYKTMPVRYYLHIRIIIELLISYYILDFLFLPILKHKSLLVRNITRAVLSLLIISTIVLSGINNYFSGLDLSANNSNYMLPYQKVSKYVEALLLNNNRIIVPLPDNFILLILDNQISKKGKAAFDLFPVIKQNLISYKNIWDYTGITLRADNSEMEYKVLALSLFDFSKEHNISYIVLDTMDDYAKFLRRQYTSVNECLEPVADYGNVKLFKIKLDKVDLCKNKNWKE